MKHLAVYFSDKNGQIPRRCLRSTVHSVVQHASAREKESTMVARKYLCAAPHPDTWDERAEALLKSLGGNKARRRRILLETLSALDTETKSLRPGRKTHAEHAIAFYRHMLSLNEEDVASDQVEEIDEEIKPKKRRANKHKPDLGKPEGDSVLSMDSEEFLSQHNDMCEVCNGAGELICCSTCNLVFHLKCIRPPTTRLPPDNWSCAYCVESGVKGHARDARTRRRAAAAAREMTRLKHELHPEGTSDSEDDFGKPEAKERKAEASEKQHSEITGESVQEDEVEEGKPRAKKQKLGNESNAEDDEEGTELRPRRPRRQPALYDPQAVAASRWQSDGIIEWKSLGREQSASSDGDNKDSSDDEKESNEPIWCNFCEDDPSVPVCCFCACRVCFGKHDSAKLLLCDKCDDEYHTYCLDPPLTSVPNSKKWFCPSCDPSGKKESKESPAPTPKKSKQSPRKSSPSIDSTPLSARKGLGRPRMDRNADTPGSVKSTNSGGSGRPRKNTVADAPGKSTPPARSGLGRPRKYTVHQADVEKSRSQKKVDSGVTKRPRGRPKKTDQSPQTTKRADESDGKKTLTQGNDSVPPASKASPRPGGNNSMPLVTPASTTNQMADPDAEVASLAVVPALQMSTVVSKNPVSLLKSRSGRTVKRGSFYDEIGEGEQHLKTAKLSVEPPQTRPALESQSPGDSALRDQKPSTETGMQKLITPKSTPTQTQDEKPPPKIGDFSSLAHFQTTPAVATPAVPAPLATPTVAPLSPAGAVATVATPALPQVASSLSQLPSAAAQAPAPQADVPPAKVPRRKPGARECMQISRRFGVKVIAQKYMDTLEDYCTRGKVEHLIRMRERLDDHSRMLEAQLAGLEALIKEKGELDITVPAAEPP